MTCAATIFTTRRTMETLTKTKFMYDPVYSDDKQQKPCNLSQY